MKSVQVLTGQNHCKVGQKPGKKPVISGPQTGPAERGHAKSVKNISTLFDNFRAAPVFRPLSVSEVKTRKKS